VYGASPLTAQVRVRLWCCDDCASTMRVTIARACVHDLPISHHQDDPTQPKYGHASEALQPVYGNSSQMPIPSGSDNVVMGAYGNTLAVRARVCVTISHALRMSQITKTPSGRSRRRNAPPPPPGGTISGPQTEYLPVYTCDVCVC
jgi:hypothetical protein